MLKTVSLVAFAALAVVCCVSADSLFKSPVELASHRLPTNVKPLHYDIQLDLTSAQEHPYKGRVNITVQFRVKSNGEKLKGCFNALTCNLFDDELEPPSQVKVRSNEIVMHADKSLTITRIKVYKQSAEGASGMEELKIVKTGQDKAKQLIVLTMDRHLTKPGSEGLIEIEFEGRLRTDMHGIYTSTYDSGRDKTNQIVAKFQPTFARLALPCFDEPAFKANFTLTLKHSKFQQAFATTPLSNNSTTSSCAYSVFETTPRMSIHMLAFLVSDFTQLADETSEHEDGPLVRVITPPGKAEAGAYALEVAQKSIKWFEEETGLKFPLEKLDLVAIPDTDTDNTETWGLAFVRDTLLLVDDETKPESKIATALNVAHVVAHQWFGNLITAKWWSDLWITESIVAYTAFEIVAELHPDYWSRYLVRVSTMSNVVQSDSSGKKHALSPPENELTTSSEISELFDNIQFMKSGALARLMEEALGPQYLHEALPSLVSKRAYGNVDFDDLVEELRSLPTWKAKHEDVMWSWATLKSYPLINAVLDESGSQLVLYQEPYPTARKDIVPGSTIFSLETEDELDAWTLPVDVFFSDTNYLRHKFNVATLSPGGGFMVRCPRWFVPTRDWLKVSAYSPVWSYYRVRYSDKILHQFQKMVSRKLMDTKDRLHLLDDANALVSSGLIKSDTFKELLGWYANEEDDAMIIELLTASRILSTLELSDQEPSPISQVFIKLHETHGFNVSGSETPIKQRAREVTLSALIAQGVQQVIQDGVKAFAESQNGKVALFLREPVYAAVVAGGTEEQVELLLANLQKTTSFEEKVRLARALALSNNSSILESLSLYLDTVSGLKDAVKAPIKQLITQTQTSLASSSSD